MAATVIDVGLKAGCSPATVSRVLNGTARVSETVRQNVFRAIAESGYVPRGSSGDKASPASKAIARKSTLEVIEAVLYLHELTEAISIDREGFHVNPAQNPDGAWFLASSSKKANSFWHDVVAGVMHELHDWKIKGVVRICGDLTAQSFVSDLNAGKKQGVLLVGNYSPDLAEFVDLCNVPLVLVDMIPPKPADAVIVDNYGGIASAVQHLVSLGHRDIAYLGVPGNPNYHERRVSFITSMFDAGLTVRPEWLNEGPSLVESAFERVAELLSHKKRPTALVCCNDFLALGAMRATEKCKISVPDDLSIVGFDDVDGASFMSPPLTTVRVPKDELGRCAVRQLLLRSSIGEKPDEARSEVRVKTRLIVRQSTAAPRSGKQS